MRPGIDFSTLSFGEPLYLWLLAVPGGLLVLWVWQVLRRRADERRLMRDRVLPVWNDTRYSAASSSGSPSCSPRSCASLRLPGPLRMYR